MGAQISKNGAKDETVADKPAEAANKSNGQENGHTKTNGNASPNTDAATEDVQANGKNSADEELKAEEGKTENGGDEKTTSEGNGESSAVANGEDSTKSDEISSASANDEPAKQKKRFSFKKPFKLGGFSFKKSAKKEAEGGEAAEAVVENGEQKKDAEAEEAKPEASSEEAKTEAPTVEPKAEEPTEKNEKKTSNEVTEEKQAEPAPQEPAAATESSEAPAAATE
ncbi:myristoylated alanine-rich protein kinase C substrate b [Xyrauchen texanus]|uniref:myristoylated alanine-rich protein kinase C substrate b n=1 Tax=Xyrauchen texanus TaxID=154827 RepID=UPI00224204AB|nr:myristoylated alanine-rich protein kinase C substrate b [Xyrauchen texanus]